MTTHTASCSAMSVDTAELTRRWRQSWPDCPPIGHLFRHYMSDRWVRFHSLPQAQRYPATAAEYHVVLHRYNAVLAELMAETGSAAIYVVTVEYGPADGAAGTEPVHVGLHPGAIAWISAADPTDSEAAYQLHVSRADFHPGALDDLLRYVADDRTSDVIVADEALRWLFHPYDGGMDVVTSSAGGRDRLAQRFRSWLSDRPDGL